MDTCTIRFEHKLSTALSINESMTADGIIRAINKQRKLKRLDPVTPDNTIDRAAKIQARQMASTGQFAHVLKGVKYPSFPDRMRAIGLAHLKAGEVLYSCNPGMDDSEVAVQAWLGSKQHREAVLHPDVEEIGISVQYAANGRPYACAVLAIPDSSNKDATADFADELIGAVKKYGKTAGKKLLVKAAQSDQMKKVLAAPIIQKIIAALR